MTTRPSALRAARPIVWMSDLSERRKPSLSASRIATSETSGRSSPSRRRVIPTRTADSPGRRAHRRRRQGGRPPQEVDPDEPRVPAEPKLPQQLDPAQRVDLAVEVAGADAGL